MSDVVLNNRGDSILVLPGFVVNMNRVICAHPNRGEEHVVWPWVLHIAAGCSVLRVDVPDVVYLAYTAWLRGEDFADE